MLLIYFDNSNFPKTKTEGIYIAGDCVDKELRQIATAVSDGAIAATTAVKEMKGE
jgi:thioredoxin reductase (NADPH)